MKLRHGPLAATSLLKFFCPDSEYDSVIGDLTEQYQQGHGPLWYWKQVLSIVLLGNYRHAVDRPLVVANRIPLGTGFLLVFGSVALLFTVLSDIPLWVPAVIGGPIAFGLIRLRDNRRGDTPPFEALGISRITGAKIPLAGAIGRGLVSGLVIGKRPAQWRESPTPHLGINSANMASEGLEGLPGLIMAIAFVFLFLSLFMPRNADWMLGVFIVVEVGAAALYVRSNRRNREAAEKAWQAFHELNEGRNHKSESFR
jgi:hypothetical protein